VGSVEEHEVRRDARVWSEDTVGETDDGMKIESLSSSSFDAGADPVAKECTVGHNDGSPARFGRALEFTHDELEEKKRGFGGLLVFGKLPKMPRSSSPPNGGWS